MSYSEDKARDEVVLRMTRQDYENRFLPALGLATGALLSRGGECRDFLEFVNRVNAGNPKYTPYKIRERASR